jgi:hypothetical protein
MKKVTPKTSLKAITTLYFLLITLFTSSAQQGNWEIGIGLRPLNLKDEPYTIILKKHLSSKIGLRFGLSGMYSSSSEHFEYTHPYFDTIHSFSYRYTLIDTKMYLSTSLGIQYRIGKRNPNSRFFWYGASDAYVKYHLEKPDVPDGVYFPIVMMRLGDYIVAADYDQRKTLAVGGRQGLGLQYFINTIFSVSLEGGFFYQASFSKVNHFLFAGLHNETVGNGIIAGPGTMREYEDFQLGFSPVMQLAFNYHF